ncbi:MAG: hypothetical protein QOG72_1299 [Sphingomonadales bacterium]|jgi:hypothetical protein|nr:hypothetical protein [Sphingomonadales bacterium]
MKRYLLLTSRERTGTIDGLNLFFGALLGANLGTLNTLELRHYLYFILILAGTVMALRMISTSERRGFAILFVAAYAVLIVAMWTVPSLQPRGLSEADLHRTLATVAVWIGAVLLQEAFPVLDDPAETAAPQAEKIGV